MTISKPRVFAIIVSFAIMFVSSAAIYGQIRIKIPKLPEREKPQTNTPDSSDGSSTNQNAAYDKETFDSIYTDTGYGEFGGYSRYISPYLDCYGKKHNIPQETIDMWPKMHGGDTEEALAFGQQRLAELEAKLKARMRSFPHTGLHAGENPGLTSRSLPNASSTFNASATEQRRRRMRKRRPVGTVWRRYSSTTSLPHARRWKNTHRPLRSGW